MKFIISVALGIILAILLCSALLPSNEPSILLKDKLVDVEYLQPSTFFEEAKTILYFEDGHVYPLNSIQEVHLNKEYEVISGHGSIYIKLVNKEEN